MSGSFIDNLTVGVPQQTIICQPTVVASGNGTQDVFEDADTRNKVSANAIIKYMNLRLQYAIRDEPGEEESGWVEYALIVFQEEQSAFPALDPAISANIGIQTLGDLCRNLYRGKCIWNGAVRLSKQVPEVVDLKIKVPTTYCKQKRGQFFMLLAAFRSANAADVTTSIRQVTSWGYKTYV